MRAIKSYRIVNWKLLIENSLSILKLLGKPFYSTIIILLEFLLLLTVVPKHTLASLFSPVKLAKPEPVRQHIKKTTLFTIYSILLATFLFLIITAAMVIKQYLFSDLPDIHQLTTNYRQPTTTHLYDRHGHLLYEIFQDQNRTPVKLSNLPLHLIYAHLAIEDSNFYHHPGINPPDIARATYTNFKNWTDCKLKIENCKSSIYGASTITQQLIKNTLLTPHRTWKRKLQEIILALQLERRLTKNQILEKYLNTVSYGGTAYGIEAAARTYFNKPASELSLAESTLLAGLPAAPSTYSPFGAQPKLAIQRQRQVLRRMQEEGYISKDLQLKTENLQLAFAAPDTNILAPHFIMYLRQQLDETYGPQLINQGGLKIITSLDLKLQNFTKQTLTTHLSQLKNLNVTNGAVLITRPSTGEILTMIGSLDYFDTDNQGNFNATTALRQPGSAIKPINYAVALSLPLRDSPSYQGGVRGGHFNQGTNSYTDNQQLTTHNSKPPYTPVSIINDSPVTFRIPGQPDYSPINYDNKYHGRVTLRTALASSYNIPAVKVLNSYGVDKMIDMGQNLGITTWGNRQRFGLSLTLGGGEVKMTDLAVAYGTLANLGYRVNLKPILEISYPSDSGLIPPLNPNPYPPNPILDPRVAFLLNHILSDNHARAPAFGRYSKLEITARTVAVKTGTSNNLRDNWAIGYTPDYLVAVWVGNFDNSPMSRIASGITGATPIWHEIMSYLLNEYQPQDHQTIKPLNQNLTDNRKLTTENFPWTPPTGLIHIPICPLTATLPCSGCPTREEWFISGTQPTKHCSPDWFTSPTPAPSH